MDARVRGVGTLSKHFRGEITMIAEAAPSEPARQDELTLFLRMPGAPIDNNVCERLLKTAIRHRDNSLFYKTLNGAKAGDFFMSVIQTCRLNGKDPFHYLTTIRRYLKLVSINPAIWMPWNYQATAAGVGPP